MLAVMSTQSMQAEVMGAAQKKKNVQSTSMVQPITGTWINLAYKDVRNKYTNPQNFDNNDPQLYVPCEALGGATVAETLLTPTRIYVKSILALLEKVDVKGISHITGGGFYENIPRSIPDGLCARIDKSAVKVLPIFDLIAQFGNVPERDMFNTYNMGVGMSVVVPADQVDTALEILRAHGEDAYVIGEIIEGEEKVIL